MTEVPWEDSPHLANMPGASKRLPRDSKTPYLRTTPLNYNRNPTLIALIRFQVSFSIKGFWSLWVSCGRLRCNASVQGGKTELSAAPGD